MSWTLRTDLWKPGLMNFLVPPPPPTPPPPVPLMPTTDANGDVDGENGTGNGSEHYRAVQASLFQWEAIWHAALPLLVAALSLIAVERGASVLGWLWYCFVQSVGCCIFARTAVFMVDVAGVYARRGNSECRLASFLAGGDACALRSGGSGVCKALNWAETHVARLRLRAALSQQIATVTCHSLVWTYANSSNSSASNPFVTTSASARMRCADDDISANSGSRGGNGDVVDAALREPSAAASPAPARGRGKKSSPTSIRPSDPLYIGPSLWKGRRNHAYFCQSLLALLLLPTIHSLLIQFTQARNGAIGQRRRTARLKSAARST
jgi:hypothetical protein